MSRPTVSSASSARLRRRHGAPAGAGGRQARAPERVRRRRRDGPLCGRGSRGTRPD
jgi:hypothetical protein